MIRRKAGSQHAICKLALHDTTGERRGLGHGRCELAFSGNFAVGIGAWTGLFSGM